jgi:hypothetical protein
VVAILSACSSSSISCIMRLFQKLSFPGRNDSQLRTPTVMKCVYKLTLNRSFAN